MEADGWAFAEADREQVLAAGDGMRLGSVAIVVVDLKRVVAAT